MSSAISVQGLGKRFWLQGDRRTSLKERLVRGRGTKGREFWAIKEASFDVEHGTTLGVIGHNGSGKSTVLKVLAGIYRPTCGAVRVDGRVSALLELGAGFNPELTGRDNIRLNGAILGMSRRDIDAKMDQIIEFSGIGEFIDSPVKVYSSGMYVRLGFAIAVSIEPEILIVDEVIAVGDEEFQRRCFDHLHELRRAGTTIVLVSHDLGLIGDLCDQAVWLDHGEVRRLGPARSVVEAYLADINEREAHAPGADAQAGEVAASGVSSDESARAGSGEIRLSRVEYIDGAGHTVPMLVAGEQCTFRLHFVSTEPLDRVVFGLGFRHESGVVLAGPNSGRHGPGVAITSGHGYVDFRCDELMLQPSTYVITVAIVDRGHTYDYLDRAAELRVRGSGADEPGMVRMSGSWTHPILLSSGQDQMPSNGERLMDVQR